MKILITDRFSIQALALLKTQSFFEIKTSQTHLPTQEELDGVEVLIIRSRTLIDSDFIKKCNSLKMIVTCTSGYDHIDFEATQNIKVCHTPEANAQSTAELTWLLILSAARDVNHSNEMIKTLKWERSKLNSFELKGKTLGVVGLGRVGSRVAKMGLAFGMNVIAYDPYKEESDFAGIQRVGYTELLRLSNLVTFHVPYTEETHQMLNRKLFEDCLEGMIVINASRGNVINEHDLYHGLETGVFSKAALDVFAKEPLQKDSNIFSDSRVIKTPHVGATTSEAFEASSLMAAQKVIHFFKTQTVTDELPPQVPWWKYQFRRG